eukprot:scaffold1514_cov118-Cylindrotheca_fusiformis.AAC.9
MMVFAGRHESWVFFRHVPTLQNLWTARGDSSRLYAQCRRSLSMKSISEDGPLQTMQDSYQHHAEHQYSAHLGIDHMLTKSIERWANRINMEDNMSLENDGTRRRRRKMADLGSADGSSSVKTFSGIVQSLKEQVDNPLQLEIIFEEHPSSNKETLVNTLHQHQDWFQKQDVAYSVLMKSFYEPLFAKNSMDFIMSHLCLHWLDTTDPMYAPPSSWKSLHKNASNEENNSNKSGDELNDFVFVNEKSAPPLLQEIWRTDLANRHLASFLSLRAQELRPGAELFIMMVAYPNEFVCPGKSESSPLTIAMQRCIDQGTLRPEVLTNTIVPYYQRKTQDIYDAVDLMHSTATEASDGDFLVVADVQEYEASLGGGAGSLDGTKKLFWAIHGSAVRTSGGATEEELRSIQASLKLVFEEIYDPNEELTGNFIGCVLRKRTRKPGGDKQSHDH